MKLLLLTTFFFIKIINHIARGSQYLLIDVTDDGENQEDDRLDRRGKQYILTIKHKVAQ